MRTWSRDFYNDRSLTDALGNLAWFVFLPGQRSEIVSVPALINGLSFGALLADKAFDADHLHHELQERNAKAVQVKNWSNSS